MDAHTRRLLEDMIDLGPTLTFSVGPGPPVTLTRQQVHMGTTLEGFRRACRGVRDDGRAPPHADCAPQPQEKLLHNDLETVCLTI